MSRGRKQPEGHTVYDEAESPRPSSLRRVLAHMDDFTFAVCFGAIFAGGWLTFSLGVALLITGGLGLAVLLWLLR